MIAKIDCMINKKIAEVIPGNFIMNLSPSNHQQENNKSVYNNKDFSSSLFTKQIEKIVSTGQKQVFATSVINRVCILLNQL